MGQEYRRTAAAVSLINYHFVFCPRYRRKVLVKQVEARFNELVLQLCIDNHWLIVAMEVMPDHVHLHSRQYRLVSCHGGRKSTAAQGLDLGLKVPAVVATSTGKTRFVGNGRQNKYIRRKYKEPRRKMGKLKKLSAIRKQENKEHHYMKDQNHN
nr:IS200/IS605 family transposase [Paenibacillus sp. S150]